MADDRRVKRVADSVKRAVSDIIEFKLKNPHKGFITITRVRMSPDLRIASIYYTVLGDEQQRALSAQVLEHSRAFIRNELKPAIRSRWLPELRFFYDEAQLHAEQIDDLLQKIKDDSGSEEGQ
ncbi:MAG TPA: 30S ribosome-binding factor RbfA [Caldithrix abyssi]|uniref:Ribosome-binding factor A n=1 Tax=Caldithrix abyssi TaxID=187145 RepID=A0A7V5UFZ7_CALAY|nr:30S ribosome-binding factor RbfA [Caldithrix abyssi]